MRCPFCRAADSRVVDSRLGKEGDAVRRRRHCDQCGRRFTTYERADATLPLIVKKDGGREPFDRQNQTLLVQPGIPVEHHGDRWHVRRRNDRFHQKSTVWGDRILRSAWTAV